MRLRFYTILLSFSILSVSLFAQTIAEKKAGSSQAGNSDLSQEMQTFLTQLNKEIKEYQDDLKKEYAQVIELYNQKAPESSYEHLLKRINEIKSQIQSREKTWTEMAVAANSEEGYALWHQPETSLGQLVMDYGSQNYVYLLTPDIAQMKISVDSNLPIPRASWNEMLEIILTQNGVGIKQLNPYLRQLYVLKEDRSNIRLITNKRTDLEIYPSDARICFVLTPEPSDVRRIFTFLEKFANPNSTILQLVGRDILIIAQVAEVQEMLKLYDFVALNRGDKEYKAIPLTRVNPMEMSKILAVIFDQLTEAPKDLRKEGMAFRERNDRPQGGPRGEPRGNDKPRLDVSETLDGNGLKVIALGHIANAIFLVGTKEEIKKAEQIIRDVENQVGEAREKVIYWYTAKHSEAEELANVLERVYNLMVTTGASLPGDKKDRILAQADKSRVEVDLASDRGKPTNSQLETGVFLQPFPPRNFYDDGYYLDDRHIVNPRPDELGYDVDPNEGRKNFIVDPKTGAVVMVVEADILPKLKELIKKLDVPKKMVQIEVLLFEKRVKNDDIFGLNLLRLGDTASNKNKTGVTYSDPLPINLGITEFFLSRMGTCSGIPAFDLVYKFLLTQENVQINASPSILTLNQTPARIDIEEEISVNTGIFEIPTTGGVIPKESFARARYGIKITVTPTIHVREDDDPYDNSPDYVTLESDIVFETIQRNLQAHHDRPDVTRRIINNTVNLPDGQSVIIGGLRRKETDDTKDGIPFLSDLPGIGKLFCSTRLNDDSTEMFIVITPKIVVDPCEQLERLKMIEAGRRPGDIPSFLAELQEARDCESEQLMQKSITLLFGRMPDRIAYPLCEPVCEYDGR